MSLKIALILSVVFQFITAIIALTLIKRTRTNIAWWLISIGFLLMAIRRVFEMFFIFNNNNEAINNYINSWLGVGISVIMLLSLGFIKRIFNIQERLDKIKAENESRVFSAIIKAEEKQKHDFSRELHDGLAPLLSSVKMSVTALNKTKNSDNEVKILTNTDKLINEALKTVKEISNKLSPHVLVNFGLLKALKSFVNKMPEDNVPKINIESNIAEKRYEHTIETVLYRVFCELITNSIKHADARNIYITIIEDKTTLNIKYLDDGIGFVLEDFEKMINKGSGLTNIISRIKSVHGSSNFYSEPGLGFNANFVINI